MQLQDKIAFMNKNTIIFNRIKTAYIKLWIIKLTNKAVQK